MTNKIIHNGLVLASFLLVSACASAAVDDAGASHDKAKAKVETQHAHAYARMSSLIEDASCKTSAQCASMPVGNAACGGPANYLVYSTMIGDKAISELSALSERTKELDIAKAKLDQDSGNGMSGICRFNTPSDVACIDNVCKAVVNEIIR